MIKDKSFQELCVGYARYEAIRKLNPRQFQELWEKNLKEEIAFDDLVDGLIEKEELKENTWKCPHCGSEKGTWFSRIFPMSNV